MPSSLAENTADARVGDLSVATAEWVTMSLRRALSYPLGDHDGALLTDSELAAKITVGCDRVSQAIKPWPVTWLSDDLSALRARSEGAESGSVLLSDLAEDVRSLVTDATARLAEESHAT